MSLGRFIGGRHQPITPWTGSWAWQEERRSKGLPLVPVDPKARHQDSPTLNQQLKTIR